MGMTKDELNFKPRLQVIHQKQIEKIHNATLDVLERTIYANWTKAGAKRFEQRLQELTLETMKHRPEPLDDDLVKKLNKTQAS